LWLNNIISNFDYLLLLNAFSGRSFADLSQYPIMPWVSSPQLELRDLSKPMGQLTPNRATHYEQTYELSSPKYFYGFHYSLPGAVFWLLMRLPPFTFFQWDLNEGWDDSQRLFTSILDAYQSASCTNPSDLKELIPQLYTTPECLENTNGLKLAEEVNEKVTLPSWATENSYFFVETFLKLLNGSPDLHLWIDLVFGCKQTGEAAVLAKNVFLPSSYHSCAEGDVDMERKAFVSQVLNFGQCPVQLFQKEHPSRLTRNYVKLEDIIFEPAVSYVTNPTGIENFLAFPISSDSVVALPKSAALVSLKNGKGCYFDFQIENECLSLFEFGSGRLIYQKIAIDFQFISHLSVTPDGLFLVVTFEFGRVDVYQIRYEKGSANEIHKFSSFTEKSKCFHSSLLSSDFICASVFEQKIVMWNVATQLRHREILFDFAPVSVVFDQFNAILSIVGRRNIAQYSVNGKKLHAMMSSNEITATALLPVDFSFDKRVLVVGHADGSVSLVAVGQQDYRLRIVANHSLHKHKIVSIYINTVDFRMTIADDHGVVSQTSVSVWEQGSAIQKCATCGAPESGKCSQCQNGLCDSCRDDAVDLCPPCAKAAAHPQ
jgi:hypothetical protein